MATFKQRFAMEVPPTQRLKAGNLEAALDTLRNLLPQMPPTKDALTAFLDETLGQMDKQKPTDFTPWKSSDMAVMPFPASPNVFPAELLAIPEPPAESYGGKNWATETPYPVPTPYSRIGFPEAVNPMTFANRLRESSDQVLQRMAPLPIYPQPNAGSKEAAIGILKGEMPQVDPAQDMVDEVIANPEGEM